jgi:TonB family protein
VASELGRYFAAEYRASAEISKTTDVYSLGAILYLLVTGVEPPDAVTGSAFAQTIRAAKTFSGQPLPDDLRAIIEKSLAIDPAARYATIGDMKQVLSGLVHGGNYSASTFNLAFYLSNLLKKELEGEALEREKESKVNAAAYAEAPIASVTPMPMVSSDDAPAKSRMPLYAAAAAVVVAVATGAFYILKPKPPVPVARKAAPPKALLISQPIVAAAPATSTTAPLDPAAQKKAFEAAVQQKMQEEMMKLQSDMNRQLKQQQSKSAPVQTASLISPPQSDDRGSAAALDQRRVAAQPLTQTQAPAPPPVVPQPQTSAVAPPPLTPVSTVREGDLVDVLELDKVPQLLSTPRPNYPPLAAQQHAEATIILSTLISENGDVTDVKVLRGDARFGFNDSAIRAMRAVRFTPPMKDGKRVKTWRPQSITFAGH